MNTLITLLVLYIGYKIVKSFVQNAIKDHKHQTVLNLLEKGDVKAFTNYVNKKY